MHDGDRETKSIRQAGACNESAPGYDNCNSACDAARVATAQSVERRARRNGRCDAAGAGHHARASRIRGGKTVLAGLRARLVNEASRIPARSFFSPTGRRVRLKPRYKCFSPPLHTAGDALAGIAHDTFMVLTKSRFVLAADCATRL